MRKWQHCKIILHLEAKLFAGDALKLHDLEDVGDYVGVGDHDRFLDKELLLASNVKFFQDYEQCLLTYRHARSAAGIAQICSLPCSLSLDPLQRLQRRQTLAFGDQIVNGDIRRGIVEARNGHYEDAVSGDSRCVGSLERIVKQRSAGEYSLGARCAELVFELLRRVCGAGWRDDAGEAVDGVGKGKIVDLTIVSLDTHAT